MSNVTQSAAIGGQEGTAGRPHSILAEYDTPADLMHAAEAFRDAGYKYWDVYSPFPIHGMDDAMGLGNSNVGWFTFIGGCTGFTIGMSMIWWMGQYEKAPLQSAVCVSRELRIDDLALGLRNALRHGVPQQAPALV
jgi:hypothetical protein